MLTWEYNTDSMQVRELSLITAKSIKRSIQIMEQEFVVLIYALKLSEVVEADLAKGCIQFYTNEFGFGNDLSEKLCTSTWITTFNWENKLQTSRAWLNIYLNGYSYNASDYVDLMFLTSYTDDQIEQSLNLGKFNAYLVTKVMTPIYELYKYYCTLSAIGLCTPRELTYTQWSDMTILNEYPMSGSSDSYATAYPDFTKLSYNPELGSFLQRAG